MRKAALALGAFLVLTGCSRGHSSDVHAAPSFELTDLAGDKVSLAQFKGHPVMLDFWATWCEPCMVAAPYVEAFYERHKKDGLVVLGMNMDDDPSVVYAYVKRLHTPYPVLLAGNSSAASDYRVEGFPSFVLIDSQGRAVQIFEGFGAGMPEAWESELQQILAKSN